jgi:hypothetical protein
MSVAFSHLRLPFMMLPPKILQLRLLLAHQPTKRGSTDATRQTFV